MPSTIQGVETGKGSQKLQSLQRTSGILYRSRGQTLGKRVNATLVLPYWEDNNYSVHNSKNKYHSRTRSQSWR